MKKKLKYILVVIIFIIIMSLVLYYFYNEKKDIKLLNKAKSLLEYSYNLDTGEYEFKDGTIYGKDKNYISDKFNIIGNGKINVDKYGNVKFYINTDKYCINKTSLGNIKLLGEKCDNFKTISVEVIKNNSKISFTSLYDELEYKISNNDDFNGEWIKEDYKGNLIINTYMEGKNYIWFKDKDGNLSDVLTFEMECLQTNKTKYDKDVLYCTNSIVNFDNIDWLVIEDKKSSITLMKKDSLDIKLPHCLSNESDYCYITNNKVSEYKWSNSYINYYLNNVFINSLSKETRNKLVFSYICDDYDNNNCNNEGCLGYRKEIINNNKYNCNKYVKSLIRLIDYNEYNKIYSKLDNKIDGNFWIMNSFIKDMGSIIDSDYEIFILENPLNENEIKPVITINKNI